MLPALVAERQHDTSTISSRLPSRSVPTIVACFGGIVQRACLSPASRMGRGSTSLSPSPTEPVRETVKSIAPRLEDMRNLRTPV